MVIGAVALLGLALSAPPKAAPQAPTGPVVCTKYRVLAEKSDLAGDEEIAGWASAALERAGLRDERSPCYLHVRITAGPIRSGGRQDGWVAHVAVSVRRYLKDGKLVSQEKGTLLVEAVRETLVEKARGVVEEFVARLGSGASPPQSDRG